MTSLPRGKSKSICLFLGLSAIFLCACKPATTQKSKVDIDEAISGFLIERKGFEHLHQYQRITLFYIKRCQSCIEQYQAEITASDSSAFILQTYEPMSTRVLFQDYIDEPNVFLLDVRKGIPPEFIPDPEHPVQKIVRSEQGHYSLTTY